MYEGVRVGYVSMSSNGNSSMVMRFGPLPNGMDSKDILDLVRESYLMVPGVLGEPAVSVIPHGKKSIGVSVKLPPGRNGDFSQALHELVERALRESVPRHWQADGMS